MLRIAITPVHDALPNDSAPPPGKDAPPEPMPQDEAVSQPAEVPPPDAAAKPEDGGDSPTALDDDEMGLPKLDQSVVVYMGPEQGPFQCSNCVYWEGPKTCHIVSGDLDPAGCCDLFTKGKPSAKSEEPEPGEGPEGAEPEPESDATAPPAEPEEEK